MPPSKYYSTTLEGRINEEVEYVLDNCEQYDTDAFNDWLDELDEPCKVGTLEYSQSQVLKNCDPVAYDMCYHDDFQESNREQVEEAVVDQLEDEYALQCPKCYVRNGVEPLA